LESRSNLATWTGRAGDPVSARDQFANLVPLCQQALGREHPGTLETRGNLAEWTGLAGDPEAARDQFAELEPLYRRVLGDEHPESLTALGNLATWTDEPGIRQRPGTSSPTWRLSRNMSLARNTPRH
jgi:Tetratricopeptide repeat